MTDLTILLPLIGSLFGTIIGGLISYFSIRAIEYQKWEQQKVDTLQENRRKAIVVALEWIDPHKIAINQANSLMNAFLFHRIDLIELEKEWPDILRNPSIKDPSVELQIFLPEYTYRKYSEIRTALLDVKFTVSPILSMPGPDEFIPLQKQNSKIFTQLENALEKLRGDLTQDYLRTYSL